MYRLRVRETQRILVFEGDELADTKLRSYWRTVALADTRERLELMPKGIDEETVIEEYEPGA